MRRKGAGEKMATDPKAWQKVVKMCEAIKAENRKQPEDNLEYDLLNTQWITDKTEDDVYAQNLYAALCNNKFYKVDMKEPWTCSWRYAGGIVADLRSNKYNEDYLHWYCSGIYGGDEYIREGTITGEIIEDLQKLGWTHRSYEWPIFKNK